MSLAATAICAWLFGITPEFKAFSSGIGIFSVNLALWIIIVRELLNSAADSAETLLESLNKLGSVDVPETSVSEARDETDASISTWESGNSERKKGRQGLMILGMALKLIILGGGFYICLAVLKLQPIYFVVGFGSGLAFLAVATYSIRD
jgi:hypothetical protein